MTSNRLAAGAAYVDGEIVPISEARIPITDMGFSRSDVTYDVVAVWDGAFFRLPEHLDRFARSCARLRLVPPVAPGRIDEILHELVRRSGLRAAYVDMICTRGVPGPGVRDPRAVHNRFYAYAIPYVWIFRAGSAPGMRAVVARTVERIAPGAVDPTVKNFHWGDLVRGQLEAYDRGAEYAILLGPDGSVTEGAGYNVFAVRGGRLLTPRRGVLEGITRRTVLELADALGIPTAETDISADELRAADELFATSTAGGVMPISELDGAPVGAGRPGPVTAALHDAYWAAHQDERYATPVDYGTTGTGPPESPPGTTALGPVEQTSSDPAR